MGLIWEDALTYKTKHVVVAVSMEMAGDLYEFWQDVQRVCCQPQHRAIDLFSPSPRLLCNHFSASSIIFGSQSWPE